MILLRNLALSRGVQALFSGASLTLERGWKIGLVGANGSGKSSLLALVAGELTPDAGDCELQPGTRIARVEQEAPPLELPLIEYLMDADAELRAAQDAIVAAQAAGDGERLALAHERYALAGGYTAQARAMALLAGLGFAQADALRPVREFSGGYRMRLNLGRALVRPSDLLLLDEPTNHLDLDTILWFENWLRGYAGMLLVVSHDRDFLDRVSDHTLAIANSALRLYAGNYSAYERLQASELSQQAALAARQSKEVQRITSFVERFRAKASKARQAQSRLKQLERMTEVAPVYAAQSFRFQFEEPERQPERIVALEDAAAGYGERAVLAGVSMTVVRSDRLAVIGANGAGKTTLVRLLAGELAPLAGRRSEGRGIVIGYFAQHQVEMLRAEETPLAMMLRLFRGEREQKLRDFLGRFGFAAERAERPIGPLSGGEKSRLALAALVRQRPNLLLLDEPTNHLDLEMRRSLAMALQGYAGALVIVSHDRHLLATCADRILVVGEGRVAEFDGDLEDYRQLRLKQERGAAPGEPRRSRRAARRDDAAARETRRTRLRPLEQRLARVEARVEKLSAEHAAAVAQLAEPGLYADAQKQALAQALEDDARLKWELARAESEWLEISEQLEAMRAS
ncbi:MAG TPA: ATP-binding cassette domain-containing protein [Burkholderiales bacterium]|nr:ATP-binding cassette domain-containing protein [Burkholderiales bacterium]